jgi:hypothetical protein
LTEGRESPERVREEAISRALRDNLAPLERTATELRQALSDLVAACSSGKPANALPAMLRAQAFSASLSASLSVLSNFVAMGLNPPDPRASQAESASGTATAIAGPSDPSAPAVRGVVRETHELPLEPEPAVDPIRAQAFQSATAPDGGPAVAEPEVAGHGRIPEPPARSEPAFDLSSFPSDVQDLHRRANRVAKVAMQDIKLLRPNDVQLGREHKDICERLRSDLDKARKEYDRRFRAIQDHPVDYFHRWMVEILASGNVEALGEYPYPSPVLRH